MSNYKKTVSPPPGFEPISHVPPTQRSFRPQHPIHPQPQPAFLPQPQPQPMPIPFTNYEPNLDTDMPSSDVCVSGGFGEYDAFGLGFQNVYDSKTNPMAPCAKTSPPRVKKPYVAKPELGPIGGPSPNTSPKMDRTQRRSPLRPTLLADPSVSLSSAISKLQFNEKSDEHSSDEECYGQPNKYPVQIQDHHHPSCNYQRVSVRSGEKMKLLDGRAIRYYEKHILMVCYCGNQVDQSSLLGIGRANDNPRSGYEIHYNQKCKWKPYTDAVTERRVLIRLCKCNKPTF